MTSRQAKSEYARVATPAVHRVGQAVKAGKLTKTDCADCSTQGGDGMNAKLHGQHCYDGDTLICGWPEFHRCYECERIVRPGWAVCDEHADKLEVRWERVIASDEPQAEVTAA